MLRQPSPNGEGWCEEFARVAQAAVESFYREYAKNAGVVRFPGGAQNRFQKWKVRYKVGRFTNW
jgi:hypothetical protein